MSPNVWGKHGLRPGQYKRVSVDRDVQEFIGWQKLEELFDAMPNRNIRDVEVATFLTAARITEALMLRKDMFVIKKEDEQIMVKNFLVLKRFRKVDHVVVCGRCQTINNKYDVVCKECGANLVAGGHKKFVTRKIEKRRLPFYFPLRENFVPCLTERIDNSKNWLFPSPYTGRPYTRQWAYDLMANTPELGQITGLPHLYNHWFRSQRLMQLGNEYGLDEMELKAFTGIEKSETVSRYAKKVKSYRQKMRRES